jgi:hypothetical protein
LRFFPKRKVSKVTVSQKASNSRVNLKVRLTFFHLWLADKRRQCDKKAIVDNARLVGGGQQ